MTAAVRPRQSPDGTLGHARGVLALAAEEGPIDAVRLDLDDADPRARGSEPPVTARHARKFARPAAAAARLVYQDLHGRNDSRDEGRNDITSGAE